MRSTIYGPFIREGRKPSYELYVYGRYRERFLKDINSQVKRPDSCGG